MAFGKVRIGNAPVSYGVFGRAAGGPGASPEQLLATIAAAGYEGSELGPPGFFGSPEETAAAFDRVGLSVIGAYVPLHLGPTDPSAFEHDLVQMDLTCEELVAAGGDGVVVLADEGDELLRLHAPRGPGDAGLGLDDAGWERLGGRLRRALDLAASYGLSGVFHPHVGTFVESPGDVERLLELPEVTLAFDSGHLALGGGDVVACARRWRGRIGHVHVKDVDLDVLAKATAKRPQDLDTWFGDVCTALGAGDVDLRGLLDELAEAGYAGWMVVEQDRPPTALDQYPHVAAAQLANREWLARELESR